MKELGTLFRPEQYASPDESCVLEDSAVAYDFFTDFFEPNGLVFFIGLYLASLKTKLLPAWAYVLPHSDKIISISPAFQLSESERSMDLTITQKKLVDDELYFYWNGKLHAATFTSTGEMAIRGVRCILNVKDMQFVAEMNDKTHIEDIYPVRLYQESTGKFLCICWALETEDAYWYESVCSDDDHFIDKVDVHDTVSYPINIGEEVIIGGDYYFCRYEHDWGGTCFVKTNFKATDKDRERENLILPPKKPEPFVPRLKVVRCDEKVIKKENKPTIVKLTPKNLSK